MCRRPASFSHTPLESLTFVIERYFKMENEVKKVTSISSDVAPQQPTDFPLARALSPEERIKAEKKLKMKLDARCSLFVLIYILSEFLPHCPPPQASSLASCMHCRFSLPSDASQELTIDYLDRNNIGAARLKGLQADLNLSDTQYATCLSMYVLQSFMQPPTTLITVSTSDTSSCKSPVT